MAYEDLFGGDNSTTEDFINNPLINNFATRGLLSGMQWLGETLGKPQAALFGAAKGDFAQLANLIPFSDTLGITNTGDPNKGLTSERVSGRDLLRHYGAVGSEDNWGNFAGGLALDIAADPLAFVRGPLGALTKTGEAAAKGAGTARTIAGRMAAKEGGLFSIADRPWYAELMGLGKQKNVYVAGVDPFLKTPMQAVANGMDAGWNAGTRAAIPGTNFSPLAWLRSSFETGAANVTGHPVATDVFGQVHQPKINELVDAGAEAVGATNILGHQADYLNRAAELGLNSNNAMTLASRIGRYTKEAGINDIKPWMGLDWATPEQIDLAKEFGKRFADSADAVTAIPKAEALAVGLDVGDTTKKGWKFGYAPRAQAGSGNKLGMHAHARNEDFAKVPGGAAMVDAIMSDPDFSGAKHIAGLDLDSTIKAGVAKWTPHIQQEAIERMQKVYPATAVDVPAELIELTTQEGAAKLARTMVGHSADEGLDTAARGFFYRPDLGGDLLDYPKNFAKPTAVRHSAIETLKREAEDFRGLAGTRPTTEGYVRLDDALNDIKIPDAKAELARRLGINEADLAERGVKQDLVDALRKEVNPEPRGEKSGWSKMVDAFRYGVTIPFPANLVRNWSSTLTDQAIAETGGFKGLGDATSFLRGNMTDPVKNARMQGIYQKAIEHGVVGTDQVKALLGEGMDRAGNAAINVKPAQPGKTVLESLADFAKPLWSKDAGRAVGVTPLKELADGAALNPTMKKAAGALGVVVDPPRRYMGMMEQAHHFQNEATRLQQFSNLIEQGYSPAAAAKRVKVNQRDFLEGSTPFVNDKLRNIVPFANFSVQNLKAQADMLSRNTGRYSAIISLLNSGRESGGFVPGYASSGAAIPLGSPADGKQTYLGSLGLTQEDEIMSALASFAGLSGREGIRKLASSSNPLVKVPFELATGTQVFSGRKLDDLEPSALAQLLTLGQSPDAARMLSSVASGTPAARVFSTVDRLANIEKRGPIATLLNLATGLRSVDVDQQAASQIAARDTITKMLNASDQYKLRDQLVVDPKWKGREEEMPEAIKQLWLQYQWLQQQGKKAVKEKQEASR